MTMIRTSSLPTATPACSEAPHAEGDAHAAARAGRR